jgi:hypothetical protein
MRLNFVRAGLWLLFDNSTLVRDAVVSIGTQKGPPSASKKDPFRCDLCEAMDVSLFG